MLRDETYPTNEALGVPLAVERRDVALGDGQSAALALESEQRQVVVLAVRLAVLLLEAVLAELAAALRAEKVVRMPRLVERRHAFLQRIQARNSRFKKAHSARTWTNDSRDQIPANGAADGSLRSAAAGRSRAPTSHSERSIFTWAPKPPAERSARYRAKTKRNIMFLRNAIKRARTSRIGPLQ